MFSLSITLRSPLRIDGMDWRHYALFGISLAVSGQTDPTFDATTKLVQVNVVAHDKGGAPVADLRREEFEILDNGTPQEIRLFIADAAKRTVARESLAPGTYANRMVASDADSGYSAILFDNLLTDFGEGDLDGTGFGVQKVLEALRRMPQGENIAIYAIGRKLKVIREFTTDRESIEEELRKWKPSPDDSVTGTALCIFAPSGGALPLAVTPGQAESVMSCYRNDHLQRTAPFDEELNQVADHLAGIPGRKKLIWMANQWPAVAPSTLRKFVDAKISIYPVDEGGVKGGGGQPEFAALTGGVNFARRNDLDVAVREAIEDGQVGYTLGFYPSSDATKPPSGVQAGVHQLTIRVTRPGLTLRYAASYQADLTPKRTPSFQDLIDALNRPVDSTAIGITATATRNGNVLHLIESIDLANLDLELKEGAWKGKIEVVAKFMAAAGTSAGEVVSKSITLNLPPQRYQTLAGTGLPFRQDLTIPERAAGLRLLVGNLASGKVGTLTFTLPGINGN
jgi:VWFA-related protein